MSSVLRGGRLASANSEVVEFISSLGSDSRIATAAVLVNLAHVAALAKAGIISKEEGRKLANGLRTIEKRLANRRDVEDIHVLIEEELTKLVGEETGGMLQTGKSRNDQVTTAIRMALRDEMLELSSLLVFLEKQLLLLAGNHVGSVFPGYTHAQPAQPITFAHYLLAQGDSIFRDNRRVMEALTRINASPLGAGALAGSSFKLDRRLEAGLLGFDGLLENSLDAVASRDFILETLAVCSIASLNLSRMAQDLIFFSSADVGLVELPDEFTSTSSIMPQKKNPDPLEVVRARSALVAGNFSRATSIVHGLPTGYNLDFQELTPLLWDSLDTLASCLRIMVKLVPRVKLDKAIPERLQLKFTTATEMANILVRALKIPFRRAHRAAANAVRLAIQRRISLENLEMEDWERILGTKMGEKTFRELISATDLTSHPQVYKTRGSPNPTEVHRMILSRKGALTAATKKNVEARQRLRRTLAKLHTSHTAL